ncbi:unnamed protein product, partial [marine sediment metagenome]
TSAYCQTRTYVNGGAVGSEVKTQSGTYQQAPDEEMNVAVGDTVELWAYQSAAITGYIKDFKVKGVISPAAGNTTKDS